MLPIPVRQAAQEIGKFYLNKHNGDYKAAEEELVRLRITKVEINGNCLYITASRVGLLIGKRGQNIDALGRYIEKTLNMKIFVIEDIDCLYDYLIPQKEEEYD